MSVFEALIIFGVLWVVLAAFVNLWKWFFKPFNQIGKPATRDIPHPTEKTAEQLHEEIMQVAAKDLDCSVEELKEMLKDELEENRQEKRGKPDLHIVK